MTSGTYVVAIWILNKRKCIVCDLAHELSPLHFGSMINTSLQDTTAMSMSSNFDTVARNRIINELSGVRSERLLYTMRKPYLIVLWCKLVQAFLNDVVPVQVLDEDNDVKA